MLVKNYSADRGSVAVLCGDSKILFPNGYGDGYFKVYVFDSEDEFNAFIDDSLIDCRFFTNCEFRNACVLDDDTAMVADTLFILFGNYAIYQGIGSEFGDMYFVKWDY